MPKDAESRLSSFENPNGIKGQGGKTNKTAKGNAFEFIKAGETKTLLNINVLDMPDAPLITDEKFPDGWVNFYRVDDYSSVSYFYLNKPSSELPSLSPIEIRTKNVK